eukprot:gene4777-3428_t
MVYVIYIFNGLNVQAGNTIPTSQAPRIMPHAALHSDAAAAARRSATGYVSDQHSDRDETR